MQERARARNTKRMHSKYGLREYAFMLFCFYFMFQSINKRTLLLVWMPGLNFIFSDLNTAFGSVCFGRFIALTPLPPPTKQKQTNTTKREHNNEWMKIISNSSNNEREEEKQKQSSIGRSDEIYGTLIAWLNGKVSVCLVHERKNRKTSEFTFTCV